MSNQVIRSVMAAALTVAGTITASDAAVAAPLAASGRTSDTVMTGKSLGRLGSLTDLIVERLRVSDDVAASKFGTDRPIDDPVREQQVLDGVRKQAADLGLDPDAVAAFFQDQITASKIVQRGLFARWTAHPDEAPTTRPDLAQIRARLDQLTTALLQQLDTTEDLRAKPRRCTAELAFAVDSTVVLQRLDPLHRRALRTAAKSVCARWTR
ncbi:chorismate mutase [Kribbella yunnanensis]|uniref:chorismate mutase n=1 Tax=Kribbella yunnanensis TaxID=190194 RepID=A0ABN2IVR5_9ACTN